MSYWLLALVVTGFGFLGAFSIGLPFFVVGVAMLVLGPFRRWPRVFWPALLGVMALVVGAVLVIPISCVATSENGGLSTTVCSSILGPTWSGTGLYNPPPEAFQLALRVGLVAGVTVAVLTLGWLSILRNRHA